tara:strand:- start:207 stop:1463 length:1257 start_codon:yes stop_codon:yes gene_type:complete
MKNILKDYKTDLNVINISRLIFIFSSIFIWLMLFPSHFVFLKLEGINQGYWRFIYKETALNNAFIISLSIPLGIILGSFFFSKSFPYKRDVFIRKSKFKNKYLFQITSILFFILVAFQFIVISPGSLVFISQKGDIVPGQVILIGLIISILNYSMIFIRNRISNKYSIPFLIIIMFVIFSLATLLFTSRIYFFASLVAIFFFLAKDKLQNFVKGLKSLFLKLVIKYSLIKTMIFLPIIFTFFVAVFYFYTIYRSTEWFINSSNTFAGLFFLRSIEGLPQLAEVMTNLKCDANFLIDQIITSPLALIPNVIRPSVSMSQKTFFAIHASSLSTFVSSFSCIGTTLSFLISTFIYSFISFIFLFSISLFYLAYQFDFILFFSSSIFAIFMVRSGPYFWIIPWIAIGCILPYFLSKKLRLVF